MQHFYFGIKLDTIFALVYFLKKYIEFNKSLNFVVSSGAVS